MAYAFGTVDVFTEARFGGNPLAVFPDARGLSDRTMQALAAGFNLSETTFVLPPADPANTVRVRILNRVAGMPFAGHPSIGRAFVLARAGLAGSDTLRLEVPAGIVRVELERDAAGQVVGAKLDAPQPLSTGSAVPADTIAACLGLQPTDVLATRHVPMVASVGSSFIAQVSEAALGRCVPGIRAFRTAAAQFPELKNRFPILVHAGCSGRQVPPSMAGGPCRDEPEPAAWQSGGYAGCERRMIARLAAPGHCFCGWESNA